MQGHEFCVKDCKGTEGKQNFLFAKSFVRSDSVALKSLV